LTGLLLVDKSAFAWVSRAEDYEAALCVCPIIELEVLYSARSPAEYEEVEQRLAQYRSLPMDAQTMSAARAAQRDLAAASRHRIPIPDLLIAACAQQHGAGVLHVDRHYDVLAEVLAFESVRAG